MIFQALTHVYFLCYALFYLRQEDAPARAVVRKSLMDDLDAILGEANGELSPCSYSNLEGLKLFHRVQM
jgi:hypothetical protein